MRCYELREIASEKLRGFLQTRRRFDEMAAGNRAFVTSRPRDLFDLAHLYRQTTYVIDWPSVRRFVDVKAEAYGLSFKSPTDFLDERVVEAMGRVWDADLRYFVRPLSTFDDSLAVYKELLDKVFS